MTDKPIIFSGPMIQAILRDENPKTMTRRIVKPQPSAGIRESPFVKSGIEDGHGREIKCPYEPGMRLWVRETWCGIRNQPLTDPICYRADYPNDPDAAMSFKHDFGLKKWRPSIFMPRWASRITLEIVGVRVERLQDISENDARCEGVRRNRDYWGGFTVDGLLNGRGCQLADNTAVSVFGHLWNSINAKRAGCAWEDNPWVFVIEFKRIKP